MPRRTNKIKIQTGAELWDTFRLNLLRELNEEHAETYNLSERSSIHDCLIVCPARVYRNLGYLPIKDKDIILDFWLHNLMIDMERYESWEIEYNQAKRALKIQQYEMLTGWKEKFEERRIQKLDWKGGSKYLLIYLFLGLEKMGVLKSLDEKQKESKFFRQRLYTALDYLFPLLDSENEARQIIRDKAIISFEDKFKAEVRDFVKTLGEKMIEVRNEIQENRTNKGVDNL
jgi:hypothetical protein